MRILLGLLIGGSLGAFIGYKGQCATGTCPLTSNPYIGGVYGALIGALLSAPFAARENASTTASLSKESSQMVTETHSANIVNLGSEAAFTTNVLQASKPVLVDLWAPWCGPCRAQAPVLERLAGQLGDAARIVKVNVDQFPRIASELGVQGIPTLVIFRDGKESERFVGLQTYETLKEALGA